MCLDKLLTPKSFEYYKDIATDMRFNVHLSQDESCVVLKSYDYGLHSLTEVETELLERIISKLKSQIWP